MGNAYRGSKATAGLCQPLIALMPPHSVYMETHLGGGAIMRRKPAALRNIGIDLDGRVLAEFEAHQVQFKQLCRDGKVGPECTVLFNALLLLVQLLIAVFMEKATLRRTRNSGLPSSQTGPDETARRRPGGKGKGPGT